MLRYYYYLVAIFTLTSVLVIYVIVLDRTMEACRIQVHVAQASRCIHSDTVACLVNRGKMGVIRDSGRNNVAFQWSQNVKHKTYRVKISLVKTENLQASLKILYRALKTFLNTFLLIWETTYINWIKSISIFLWPQTELILDFLWTCRFPWNNLWTLRLEV